MRRFCLFLCFAAIVASAGWGQALKQATVSDTRMHPTMPQELEATGATAVAELAVRPPALPARKAAATSRKASIADSLTLGEIDVSLTGTKTPRAIVRTKAYGTNKAYIYNMWGFGDTLKATYDQAAGTISITPGQIYNHATYGPIWICPYDATAKTYSTTSPITGTIAADGTITLGGWGVFVTSGQYKGGAFALYKGSELLHTNAVMHDTLYNSENPTSRATVVSYPVYLYKASDDEVSIVNFSSTGAVVEAVLNPDKSVTIAPQRVLSNSYYGDFYCYSHDWSVNSSKLGTITATGTATSWTLGGWGIFARTSTNVYARGYWNSKIEFDDGTVTYPQAKELTWTGSGTQADPYVITTLDQLQAFAQSVNMGQSYKDKYIALGADIDMSTLAESYHPIGTADRPFNGTFDGQGHTLSGWTHTSYDESYQGIFGYAGPHSTLKNLNITGASFTSYGSNSGTLVGYTAGAVSDITVTTTQVNHQNSLGGGVIGAFNGTTATNLSFNGTMQGQGETGGVIGEVRGGTVTGLQSHGSVSASAIFTSLYNGVGGCIGGTVHRTDVHISHCYNDAMVSTTASAAMTGGVVGSLAIANLSQCFNLGPVSAACATSIDYTGTVSQVGAAGGVAGRVYGATMTDCYNSNIVINAGNGERVGGLLGYVVTPIRSYVNGHLVGLTNTSAIATCYNSGEVVTPTMHATQGFYGTTYADSIFTNCYFDQQLTGNVMPDLTASCIKKTAELTTATLPQGFSSSVWTATQGLYPELKHFASLAESKLSISPLMLAGSETTRKVKSAFAVSSVNDIVWRIYTNSTFTTQSTGLVMSGDSVKINNVNSSEVMVARINGNDKLVKMVMLETVNPTAFRGSGTQDDPYLISDKDDLIKLNDGVVNNAQNYEGDYFVQTNDIDLENATDFVGVGADGVSSHNFAGTYDGQGYTIHRLNIAGVGLNAQGQAQASLSRQRAGFFGYLGAAAVVKNLNIAADCHFYAYDYVGAIAGYNKGTIENCRNYADVTAAHNYAGGIAGYQDANSVITGCYNAGTITAGSSGASGIVPYSKGTTSYCQNDGLVHCVHLPDYETVLTNGASGIVGYASSTAVVTGNINTGNIDAEASTAGIMLSTFSGSTFTANINYGVVTNASPDQSSIGAITARDLTTVADGYTVSANYYDKQLGYYGAAYAAPYKGMIALTTSALTSGKALEGLDSAQVDFTAGLYPVLKKFKDEPMADAHRRMVVTLPSDETIDDVRTAATLADTASWSLVRAQQFSIDGSSLRVTLAGDSALRDTLTATLGGYTKVIPLRAQPIAFAGSGTHDDPFQIRSKADMLLLAHYTNDEYYPFTGRYFKVMNDIDFGSTAYVPVAVLSHKLDADFDGNGKKFTNINYTSDYKLSTGNYFALIGNVGPNGRVHNVNLASGYMAAYGRTGAIAGLVYGTVEDCENHITVSTTRDVGFGGIAACVMGGGKVAGCKSYAKFEPKYNYVGGIVYSVQRGGTVENCENFTDIDVNYSNVGGIAAMNAGTIRNCVNHGNLRASSAVGGIVGVSEGGDSLLYCHNEGTITSKSRYAAGVLGATTSKTDSIVITGCYNTGAVSASHYAGGITGYSYVKTFVDSCYNTGDITTTATNSAGIVSCINQAGTITHCYNTGVVIAGGNYAGGIVSDTYDEDLLIDHCANYGNVMGSGMYAAGILGAARGTTQNVVNYGNIEGDSYPAGIAGYAAGSKFINCANYGDVTMTGTSRATAVAGGIVGLNTSSILTACYNLGNVTGTAYTAGLMGLGRHNTSYGPLNVRSCYTAGTVKGPDDSHMSHVTQSSTEEMTFDSVYYDIDVNPAVPVSNKDSECTGLATRQMVHAALGDAYIEREGMYPVLAELADSALSNWYAATVVLPEGCTADSVTTAFTVGAPEGTTWTATPAIVNFEGTHATPTQVGEVTITKTYGTHSRSYRLNVKAVPSGVTDVNTSQAAIVGREYFNLNGQSLGQKRPEGAGIYIERDRYSNGAAQARKIVVK